jgi:sterol desaturase/sphingolipid hydroxylase (fatty acid hydroxylase superfamily)
VNPHAHQWIGIATAVVLPLLIILPIGLLLERIRPAVKIPLLDVRFNLKYSALYSLFQAATAPSIAAVSTLMVNAVGGGLIHLPNAGWGLVGSVLAYTVAMDFGEYIFHRAQHRIPALWAMHSLHHSDPAMNVSTTLRHYWAEYAIKAATIYLAIAMLLRITPLIAGLYIVISLMSSFFFHLNLRLGFGRVHLIINSPQYHRIHHSILPQHRNKNFAALFPIFDLMFGTRYRPMRDDYPETGLYDRDQPSDMLAAIVWPMRSRKVRGQIA